jgi:serine/threonine protein kinase
VFQPAVPEALAALVDRCLVRDPRNRPGAADLARELATLADQAGARPLERIAQMRRDSGVTISVTSDHVRFT